MSKINKKPIFTGAATALATPFKEDGIDFSAFGTMVEHQLDAGIDALVVAGTTGEAATLEDSERFALTEWAAEIIRGRVPLIVGVGSNSTKRAVCYAKKAREFGANALLAVTPYYNKGTREGIRRHFLAIADATSLPVILYNVPSRTGVDLSVEDYAVLSEHPNIVAVKEADGNINKLADTRARLGDALTVYAGNDSEIVPTMALGAKGVISVVSNISPVSTVRLCHLCLDGNFKEAEKLQLTLLPLIRLLFAETNPAPVKCALALSGIYPPHLRLPMAPVSDALAEKIRGALPFFP
ncbi:MAG: 4-hydroxy-tetrahydrodipicolinate synthase [Clostridia bacterium]|nr:4-hydroxy-tetrahydrodipicolinate synthase [Clostridia bacterium]